MLWLNVSVSLGAIITTTALFIWVRKRQHEKIKEEEKEDKEKEDGEDREHVDSDVKELQKPLLLSTQPPHDTGQLNEESNKDKSNDSKSSPDETKKGTLT